MPIYISCSLILVFFYLNNAQDINLPVSDKLARAAVEDVLNKINKISENNLVNTSYNDKIEFIRTVEGRLLNAAKALGNKGEKYVKLIMKGIKSKVFKEYEPSNSRKLFYNATPVIQIRKSPNEKVNNSANNYNTIHDDNGKFLLDAVEKTSSSDNDTDSNLSEMHNNNIAIANLTVGTEYLDSHELDKEALKKEIRRMNFENIEIDHRAHKLLEATTERLIQSFTPGYECESFLDRICIDIKQMRYLKCPFGDIKVSIENLCNGIVDCPDRTDERLCISQVTERVRNANQVIIEAEQAFALHCFSNITKKSILTTEIIIFRSVLQAQQEFVEKYKYLNSSLIPNSNSNEGEDTVKKTVNEVSLIISSLSLALEAVLCSHRVKEVSKINARKFNDLMDLDLDHAVEEVEWPPKSCICLKGNCKNVTCTDSCKRVCWQKYNLARWSCESINKTESVPMSVICDGKYDCYDQSDEKDCVTGTSFAKFEAHQVFNEIFTSLSEKITSKDYSHIRNMLINLYNSIQKLQKFCMVSEPNTNVISRLRNSCFSSLSAIYSELINKSIYSYETEEAYLFLTALKENIVSALKLSNTGNKRIIAKKGCYCRNEQCSMPVCSRKCIRACIAETKLTRYHCDGPSNKWINLDELCNGKPSCPFEDDESKCIKDVCRSHHVNILHHILQTVGLKQKGTSMGELLDKWKLKVSSTLKVAENLGRPSPYVIREIIKDALSDLVTTYGAVEDYRRNDEYALKEFTNIAKRVMSVLKSCSY